MSIKITMHLDFDGPVPDVTAEEIHAAMAEHLEESYFEVTGEGDPAPVTMRQKGRAASQLLTAGQENDAALNAMHALWELLRSKSQALRVEAAQGGKEAYEEARKGWMDDDGHIKHGRMKGY